MFPYDKLQTLNEIETVVYNYIIKHATDVETMPIRQLAEQAHVSTATVLRFADKMGYDGYSELRFALKQQRKNQQATKDSDHYDIAIPLVDFFSKVNSTDFNKLIDAAMAMIRQAPMVLFFGLGSGNSLAQYGARFFSNAGKMALPVFDPFQPFPTNSPLPKDTVVIVMSVSGETRQTLEFVTKIKPEDVKIIAVTNSGNSTLAKMADLCISYYMPEIRHADLNLTTQVPVVYLIELIAHRLDELNG
ncbi:MurR/RpiR family transcriptional regulator [Lacticaseibacillus absianus]|uniref:MurR/RpiR family transcriptional regulator n=1 Tax=Lacticaseibacillus absianus TaxID=2729623 RepID=UPI0015C74119|nr:MurR/RpiR family transcriptional regulator [Lacticaseibacillus absianus]